MQRGELGEREAVGSGELFLLVDRGQRQGESTGNALPLTAADEEERE